MTLNGVMALILRYFVELVYDVVVKKSSRSLSHLLMSSCYKSDALPDAQTSVKVLKAVGCCWFANTSFRP